MVKLTQHKYAYNLIISWYFVGILFPSIIGAKYLVHLYNVVAFNLIDPF
jgi:hypothetical protein